jgi:hypothetical protein
MCIKRKITGIIMPKEWFTMKLKKASIFLGSFVLLCIMFSTCYYMSYLHALNEFNQRAIERKDILQSLTLNTSPTPAQAENAQNENSNSEQESVTVDKDTETTVQPTTTYILDIYDMKTNQTKTEELNPPAYLVGLTREQIEEYLESYMKDMPLSEYNKGLISYELIRFSADIVEIKKTYNEDFLPFRFYVVVKDGFVVVYNSDLKSVYSYTQIEAKNLPEADRIALSKGIYINSLEELYSLLESYSS